MSVATPVIKITKAKHSIHYINKVSRFSIHFVRENAKKKKRKKITPESCMPLVAKREIYSLLNFSKNLHILFSFHFILLHIM